MPENEGERRKLEKGAKENPRQRAKKGEIYCTFMLFPTIIHLKINLREYSEIKRENERESKF